MSIKLYYTISGNSYRNVRQSLSSRGIEFTVQKTTSEPLTVEQVMEMLMFSENGVEDILSERSKTYKDLRKKGVDFESLSLNRFCELVSENPTLLRSPIMVSKNKTIVGYGEEQMALLTPRKQRKEEMKIVLEKLKRYDSLYNEPEAV